MSANRETPSCPKWCDDHIEDGYHQSHERQAGIHGLLLCQDDERAEVTGIMFLEEFGGVLPEWPLDHASAMDCLDDLREAVALMSEAVIQKQRTVNQLERAIREVWG